MPCSRAGSDGRWIDRCGRSLALALALWLAAAAPAAAQLGQAIDSKGKDFYLPFMPNNFSGNVVEVHLTADQSTQVTVQYPANAPTFDTTVAVEPGVITVVSLPFQAASSWTSGQVANNTVHAFSIDEFVAYMINLQSATSDAALGLPVDALGDEYIVIDKTVTSVARFTIVAPFDDTQVSFTPTQGISGGPAAGTPTNITLQSGEAYHAQSAANSVSFAGTVITANRPIGLVNGSSCTQIPGGGGSGACDHIFEVAQPVSTWGMEIPVTNLPKRPFGSIYRIAAALDDTTVSLDGNAVGTLDRGGFLDVPAMVVVGQEDLTGSHVFSADKPIFVVQFMTGSPSGLPTDGDPAMGNMIPSAQYLEAYTFATPGANQFSEHFVTIIADNRDLDTIQLDGNVIGAASFTAIPGSDFSSAVLPILEGTHTTGSANPHGITVEGFGFFDSYLYPGGARFTAINTTDDNPPICTLVPDGEVENLFQGSASDDRPTEDTDGDGVLDPGEDLNGNGIIDVDTGIRSVVLSENAVNLTLTLDPDFIPGNSTVSFTVAPTDPLLAFSGSVIVSDGAQNTCVRTLGALPSSVILTNDWADGVALDVNGGGAPLGGPGAPNGPSMAFLAAQTDGALFIDVSNIALPLLLGVYLPAQCLFDGDPVLFSADDVVYVAALKVLLVFAGPCGLHVVDADPASATFMQLLGEFDTPDWAETGAVHDDGDGTITLFLADSSSLQVLDISNPSMPMFVTAVAADSLTPAAEIIVSVALGRVGGVLSAGLATDDGMRWLVVENPAAPLAAESYITPEALKAAPGGGISQDIAPDDPNDTMAALLSSWDAGLQAIGDDEEDASCVLCLLAHEPTASATFAAVEYGGQIFTADGTEGVQTFGVQETPGGALPYDFVPVAPPIPVGVEHADQVFEVQAGALAPVAAPAPPAGSQWTFDAQVANCVLFATLVNLDGTGALMIKSIEDCDPDGESPFSPDAPVDDPDGDGVAAAQDNCSDTSNPAQVDADQDGYGDACDADYDGDGIVGGSDFLALSVAFGASLGDADYDPRIDHDGNNIIGGGDFLVLSQRFGAPPGPSGLACAGTTPCP